MTPEELTAEKAKEDTLRRKLRNMRKRVHQGRLTHGAYRAKAQKLIEDVLAS